MEDMGLGGMSITGPFASPEEALEAAAAAGLPVQADADGAMFVSMEAGDGETPSHLPMQVRPLAAWADVGCIPVAVQLAAGLSMRS